MTAGVEQEWVSPQVEAKRGPEIPAEIDRITSALIRLQKAAALIEEKLAPVVREVEEVPHPTEQDSPTTGGGPVTPLGASLREVSKGVDNLAARMHQLHMRMEI